MAHNNKLPMIVFDDVVNAIDSDHRANIIELFFSDSYLKTVQMIVTTHDRLFWERFCNIAEKNTYADQNQSHVLMYTNRGIVAVNYAGGFREKIEYALSVFDIRQALIYCRIWFETMVVDFCLDKKIEVTARFERGNKKNNLLQISLEKTFSLVEPYIAYDKSKFDLIKNNLINWSGQNQEHHAFDEFSYNFVHSKSSAEVTVIFDAIRMFECQLFPDEKTKSCNSILTELNNRISNGTSVLASMVKAPAEVQEKAKLRLASLQKAAAMIQSEIDFIAACELAKTPPPNPA
jgi:DNA sulfur modification protein DndD